MTAQIVHVKIQDIHLLKQRLAKEQIVNTHQPLIQNELPDEEIRTPSGKLRRLESFAMNWFGVMISPGDFKQVCTTACYAFQKAIQDSRDEMRGS